MSDPLVFTLHRRIEKQAERIAELEADRAECIRSHQAVNAEVAELEAEVERLRLEGPGLILQEKYAEAIAAIERVITGEKGKDWLQAWYSLYADTNQPNLGENECDD